MQTLSSAIQDAAREYLQKVAPSKKKRSGVVRVWHFDRAGRCSRPEERRNFKIVSFKFSPDQSLCFGIWRARQKLSTKCVKMCASVTDDKLFLFPELLRAHRDYSGVHHPRESSEVLMNKKKLKMQVEIAGSYSRGSLYDSIQLDSNRLPPEFKGTSSNGAPAFFDRL